MKYSQIMNNACYVLVCFYVYCMYMPVCLFESAVKKTKRNTHKANSQDIDGSIIPLKRYNASKNIKNMLCAFTVTNIII